MAHEGIFWVSTIVFNKIILVSKLGKYGTFKECLQHREICENLDLFLFFSILLVIGQPGLLVHFGRLANM